MRFRVFALASALLALVTATSAEAGWRHARGWGDVGVVRHYGYYPRYRHVYYYQEYTADRFGYRYEPRGYYPYYNSGYWRPTRELQFRKYCCRPYPNLPPYYQAWGHPHRYYRHREWHYIHHGGHRRHHW